MKIELKHILALSFLLLAPFLLPVTRAQVSGTHSS